MNMWPQYLVLALMVAGVTIHLAKHGEPIKHNYTFFGKLISVGLLSFLLYKGGFFNGL